MDKRDILVAPQPPGRAALPERLYLEVGTDRPGAETDPVQGTVWLFNQLLGTFSLDSTVPWSVCSLPIPQAYQVAHGFVYMQVEGWCPAESGVNTDHRTLGVRLRRIWVAEE